MLFSPLDRNTATFLHNYRSSGIETAPISNQLPGMTYGMERSNPHSDLQFLTVEVSMDFILQETAWIDNKIPKRELEVDLQSFRR